MNKTLTRTQIYIEKEDLEIAKNNARFLGINLSQLIRDALKDKNNSIQIKNKKPIIVPITVNGGKPTNIAATHNDIYDY
jgi:hypothetical protein